MSRILISGSGGSGPDSSELSATAGDVVSGKIYVGADTDGEPGEGSLALSGSAAASDVVQGKTFYSNDPKQKLTGTKPTMAGQTVIPALTQQTVQTSGKAMTGNIIVSPIPNQRGQYQYASGWGGGNDNGTEYFSMNGAPEGYYVSNGQTWAPEIRMPASAVRNALGVSADKILSVEQIAGIWGNVHKYAEAYGEVTSSSTRMAFGNNWGSGTYNMYYIEIPNIGFTPCLIAGKIESSASNPDGYYGAQTWVITFDQSNNWRGMGSGVSMTSSLIRIPVVYPNRSYSYRVAGYIA